METELNAILNEALNRIFKSWFFKLIVGKVIDERVRAYRDDLTAQVENHITKGIVKIV